ncbi:MAG: helix-turn-helix transcriptional regulator [Oscillospiraceae bacterium]|nr:helix-turn-helix transcriptional regulator [Oscillospiraceae bacterium]
MEQIRISLKAARINANLTQSEASKRLGINPATLMNYEKGKTVPDWDMVKKLEVVYHMPADFISFGRNFALSEGKH